MAPRDEITSDFFMFHERVQPIFSHDNIVPLFGDQNNNTTISINNMPHDNANNLTNTTGVAMNDVNNEGRIVDIQAALSQTTGDSLVSLASTGGDGNDGLDTIIEEDIIEYNNSHGLNNNPNNESFIGDQSHDFSIPTLLSLSSSLTSIASTTSTDNSNSDNETDDDDDIKFYSNNINIITSSTPPPSVINNDTILNDLKSIANNNNNNNNHSSVVLLSSLLPSLTTPHLKALGCHLILRQVKRSPPAKKIIMASDIKILHFLADALSHMSSTPDDDGIDASDRHNRPQNGNMITDAAETLQSLTAVEDTDRYLTSEDLPCRLARCAAAAGNGGGGIPIKASLHSCIALMNLSCGNEENKRILASNEIVLESLRDLLLAASSLIRRQQRQPNDNEHLLRHRRRLFYMMKIRARATACLKNLSYSEETHDEVLRCRGLVEALIVTADDSIGDDDEDDDDEASKNALLTIVELSIPARNKTKLFRTEGLMECLMRLLVGRQTTQQQQQQQQDGDDHHHREMRMLSCLALVNLVNGHENRVAVYEYPGFVELVVAVIKEETKKGGDGSDLMNKALGILWNFAAEVKNQALMIRRNDILPLIVSISSSPSSSSESITKCLSTLTLLAETSSLAPTLYAHGVHLKPLDILSNADPDPHRWAITTPNNKGLYGVNNSNTTAPSRSLGLLLNLSQNQTVARRLRDDDDVISLLMPYINLSNHYQGLKAAMTAINLCCCGYSSTSNDNNNNDDDDDVHYHVLRRVERTIPKIISLLVDTLAGRGGPAYEYGVFQLRSPLGCIALLASGPEYAKDTVTNRTVVRCLVKILEDYCCEGRLLCPIVGGGRDDDDVARLAVGALWEMTRYLIPATWMGMEYLPLEGGIVERLLNVLECFEMRCYRSLLSRDCDDDDDVVGIEKKYVEMARETQCLILGGRLKRIRMEDGTKDDEWKKRKVVQQQQEPQQRQQSRRVTRKRKAMVVMDEENDMINRLHFDKS